MKPNSLNQIQERAMLIFAHIRHNFLAAFYPRLSEWNAAAAIFGVGLILFANDNLMTTAKTQAYDLMLMIANQHTWSVVLMSFGGLRLMILLINGAWRRSPHLRSITAFLSCFPFCLIALSFTPVFGIAMVFSYVLLLTDMVNVMRAADDARTVDDKMKAQDPNGRSGSQQSI